MTTQQPEALRLAEILEGDYCPDWFYETGVDEVSAELRAQHARITELEAQLAQRFDAADMATAAAQGFRDGATATAQPVAEQGVASAALPDEREAFEAMMRSQTFDSLKRLSDGSYESYEARVGWLAWNVRASHGQAPASVLHLVHSAFAEIAMAFPKAFALHKVGIADTAVREALAAPATQQAHQQEAQEPAAVVVPCHTPSGKRVALYSAKQDLPIGTQLYTAPQPSPTAQAADSVTAPPPPPECETEAEKRAFAFGWFKALESERMKANSELEDAARYRWLRDQPFYEWKRIAWHVSGRSPTIYADRDAAIDIARKQGEKP